MITTPIASGKFMVRQTMNQYLALDPGWLFEKRSRTSPEYETMITCRQKYHSETASGAL